MLVKEMGIDKHSSKGGFLQLFDWNGKSRKKLFSTKSDLPEGSKQGKRSNRNLPMTRVQLTDDDDNGGSSVKGSSDYSCASSVTDDEGNGIRAPGVVARLMGLDSLPTYTVMETYSTQCFDTRSLDDAPNYRMSPEIYNVSKVPYSSNPLTKPEGLSRNSSEPRSQKMENRHFDDSQSYRRTPEFYNFNKGTCSSNQPTKLEGLSRNSGESRSQKMQNRPIERFQTETLPAKSAKSIPVTHHRLLSPIKSPGFIPTKNAAQIMEAAARIIEPGPQTSTKGKTPSIRSSSVPLKVRDVKERMEAAKRPFPRSEASRRPVDSNALKHLKGQSLNKSWNGSEDSPKCRASPDSEVATSSNLASKGKSISLAVQAKVNVQRREGLSTSSSSRNVLGQKEPHDSKLNQQSKSLPNAQKNMQKKSNHIASGVLKQNNQKQNSSTNKSKLPSKPSVPNHLGRKTMSGDSLSGNKNLNKLAVNSRVGSKKAGLGTNGIENQVPSSRRKNLPQKNQPKVGNHLSERCGFVGTVLDDKTERQTQPNVTQDGHLKWMEDDRRKRMDVVSFTFTSPMIKPTPAFQSSRQLAEKSYSICENLHTADTKRAKLSSMGVNVIGGGGDALSILLEQKLKELTNRGGSSCGNSVKSASSSASILQGLVSALSAGTTTPREYEKRSQLGLHTSKLSSLYGTNCSLSHAQMLKMNHNLQGSEDSGECSSNNSEARKELRHPSPVSILEPSFSYESYSSSDGTQTCSSAQTEQAYDTTSQSENFQLVEADTELSDSASSTFATTFDEEFVSKLSMKDKAKLNNWRMEYVREVLCNVELMFKDFSLGRAREIVNPHLFHQLETRKTRFTTHEEDKNASVQRRELFDSISECLDLRCRRYVGGGCNRWAKGVAMVQRKEWLAEDVHKEISGWESMGDWMVDELVDKDMSTQYGRWLDFEVEESEVGLEIERSILSSLIDEVVSDIVVS